MKKLTVSLIEILHCPYLGIPYLSMCRSREKRVTRILSRSRRWIKDFFAVSPKDDGFLEKDLEPSPVIWNLDLPVVNERQLRKLGILNRWLEHASGWLSLIDDPGEILTMRSGLLNCFFTIETIVDTPDALKQLLRDVSCAHLTVAYDPAELLMGGIDPLAPIETYADDIGLAFARDAERGTSARPGRETNLGAGHLSLPAYLAQLDSAGYRGPLVIRRADTTRPLADLAACKEYLESILTTRATR